MSAKSKPTKAKSKASIAEEDAKLQGLLAALEKQHGKGIMTTLDGPPTIRNYPHQVPTGSIGLDIAIGPMRRLAGGQWQTGCVPGTITECFGPEGCGKTTLLLTRIANYQAMGMRCAMLDMEHNLDPHYATKLGVDMTKMWWVQPKDGEQCIDVATALVSSGLYHFVGLDSVAALIPQEELNRDSGDYLVGAQARLMSQFMRKVVPIMGQHSITDLFLTNQIRYKVGKAAGYGNPETQPGGNALKYAATFRLDVRRIKTLTMAGESEDETGIPIGHMMRVKVIKNKVSPPFRVADIPLYYGVGIDTVRELVKLCVLNGIITQNGSWFALSEGVQFQGQDEVVAQLRTNQSLCYQLYDRLLVRNMASVGLNPDGTAMPGVTMTGMPTHHAQFEPPNQEDLAAMAGQDQTA